MAGAPLGNTNASQENRLFNNSLKRSIAQEKNSPDKLKKITDNLVTQAGDGNLVAIKEVADRLDGKPAQAITGPSGEPITLVERVIVVQAIDLTDDQADKIIDVVPEQIEDQTVR